MTRITEIERFDVRDKNGSIYTVIRYQEWAGSTKTYQSLKMLTGKGVQADDNDPDLFYLPIGFVDPWEPVRRV